MFGSFFKSSGNKIDSYLSKIQFLMAFFEGSNKNKEAFLKKLKDEFSLDVGKVEGNYDDYLWDAPGQTGLQFAFKCLGENSVKQFMIISACEELGPLHIFGSSAGAGGKIHWTLDNNSALVKATSLSRQIEKAFWTLPGWRSQGSSGYRYLVKAG